MDDNPSDPAVLYKAIIAAILANAKSTEGLLELCRSERVLAVGRRILWARRDDGSWGECEPDRTTPPKPIPADAFTRAHLLPFPDGLRLCISRAFIGAELSAVLDGYADVSFDLLDLLAVHKTLSIESAEPTPLRPARSKEIRETLTAVYDEAPTDRPPNLAQVVKPVQDKLVARGFRASRDQIQKIADEPQFKGRRSPAGRRRQK